LLSLEKIVSAIEETSKRYEEQLLLGTGINDFATYQKSVGVLLGLAKARQAIEDVVSKEANDYRK